MANAKSKTSITEYRSYYLPTPFPVLLLSGDYWKISDIPSGRQHFHNCLEIGICHSDSGSIEFYGKPIPFREGDVTIIPKNVPHTTYSAPGTESHWSYLYIDPRELFRNTLPSTWQDFDLTASGAAQGFQPIFNREQYPKLYSLVLAIIRELEEQKPHYQFSATGLLLSFYIEVCRLQAANRDQGSNNPSASQKNIKQGADTSLVIAPALEYIETNYMQQFSIDQLAALCHWSPTHFRRVFHEIMGMPPLDFVNSTRINQACKLLQGTEESILNISETVGFRSVSSFNRCFIKLKQIAPREYRKQARQSDQNISRQSVMEYAGWMYPEKSNALQQTDTPSDSKHGKPQDI